jgi:hypothetical protein
MNFRFTDYPQPVALSVYEKSLSSMTARLMDTGAIAAIYQLGGVSNAGISDIDMLAVFKNDVVVNRNFLEGISEVERYLFIHNLYGISESNFGEAQIHSFYYKYKLLAGKELPVISLNKSTDQQLNIQVALEFLLKFFITLELQKEYGVIRLRDLLLHVKALEYDLEFLGIKEGIVYDCIADVLSWRNNWFNVHPAESYVNKWMQTFYPALNELVADAFAKHTFFLPRRTSYRISRNMEIIPAHGKILMVRKGLLLPVQLSGFGKKYFRLQNRLNRFQIMVPVTTDRIPPMLENKFHFEKKIVEYNKKFLPYFLPLTSSLHII